MRKCAQDKVVGVKIVRPFALDTLYFRLAQARLDRTDYAQGDFVLKCENITERTVITLGP
jgi:hypothetical protein